MKNIISFLSVQLIFISSIYGMNRLSDSHEDELKALYDGVLESNKKIVELLLAKRSSVNAEFTPLHCAALQSHKRVVNMLLNISDVKDSKYLVALEKDLAKNISIDRNCALNHKKNAIMKKLHNA